EALAKRPPWRGQHQRREQDQIVTRIALPQLDLEAQRSPCRWIDERARRIDRRAVHPVGVAFRRLDRRNQGTTEGSHEIGKGGPQRNWRAGHTYPGDCRQDERECETEKEGPPGRLKRLDEPEQSSRARGRRRRRGR